MSKVKFDDLPTYLDTNDAALSIANGFAAMATTKPGWYTGEIVYRVSENGTVDRISELLVLSNEPIRYF